MYQHQLHYQTESEAKAGENHVKHSPWITPLTVEVRGYTNGYTVFFTTAGALSSGLATKLRQNSECSSYSFNAAAEEES
jgi:hypothetical protein